MTAQMRIELGRIQEMAKAAFTKAEISYPKHFVKVGRVVIRFNRFNHANSSDQIKKIIHVV